MNKKATPLSSLGLKALLQLQDQQVNVSKELRALGHPELIRFTTSPEPSKDVEPVNPEQVGKYHVSVKELRTEDGIVFDSKLERAAYVFMKSKHVDFDLHPRFVLQEKFTDAQGYKFRSIVYEADFLVRDGRGGDYVVDMKGKRTVEFIMKEKMFTLKYQRRIYCPKTIGELWELLINTKVIGNQ